MINPNYLTGRYLFIMDGCPRCAMWEKFIREFNLQLKPGKRIKLIDCTYYDMYGVLTDPIIKLYEKELDGYPILFIGDSRKDGAETTTECKAWIKIRLFSDFIYPPRNVMLPIMNKPIMFNKSCRHIRGRVNCENVI